jgi:hypothetical protein
MFLMTGIRGGRAGLEAGFERVIEAVVPPVKGTEEHLLQGETVGETSPTAVLSAYILQPLTFS